MSKNNRSSEKKALGENNLETVSGGMVVQLGSSWQPIIKVDGRKEWVGTGCSDYTTKEEAEAVEFATKSILEHEGHTIDWDY